MMVYPHFSVFSVLLPQMQPVCFGKPGRCERLPWEIWTAGNIIQLLLRSGRHELCDIARCDTNDCDPLHRVASAGTYFWIRDPDHLPQQSPRGQASWIQLAGAAVGTAADAVRMHHRSTERDRARATEKPRQSAQWAGGAWWSLRERAWHYNTYGPTRVV